MKKLTPLFSALAMLIMIQAAGQTNGFYDDAPTMQLKGAKKILVTGEIEKEVTVDLSRLPKHTITVKETTITDGKVGFTGAYRYDGYSVYDILDRVVLKKKNEAEFPPITDLYVEITNDRGEETDVKGAMEHAKNTFRQIGRDIKEIKEQIDGLKP